MYVTRPLKQFINSPETLSWPPEGPNSGYLVLDDDQQTYMSCCGTCESVKGKYLEDTPIPQNKDVCLDYQYSSDAEDTVLIPVINQPLSSNRYYAIKAHGKSKGKALTSSREEDAITSCCCTSIVDVKSRTLDPNDLYQQYEITKLPKKKPRRRSIFSAKSSAPNGMPPVFLRSENGASPFSIYVKPSKSNSLKEEAIGINTSLQGVLPSDVNKSLEIGRWYCPFMFVVLKDGTKMRDQMKRSMFYEMTLERKWEKNFGCRNDKEDNIVVIDVIVEKERIIVGGGKASRKINNESDGVDGMIWFESVKGLSVGLRKEIVEKMKWEEERNGWTNNGEENEESLKMEEKLGDNGSIIWREFNCFVLVESFALKMRDGSLVLSYDFRHTQHIKCKWD